MLAQTPLQSEQAKKQTKSCILQEHVMLLQTDLKVRRTTFKSF